MAVASPCAQAQARKRSGALDRKSSALTWSSEARRAKFSGERWTPSHAFRPSSKGERAPSSCISRLFLAPMGGKSPHVDDGRAGCASAFPTRILRPGTGHHDAHGARENVDIEPRRPIAHVFDIHLDAL